MMTVSALVAADTVLIRCRPNICPTRVWNSFADHRQGEDEVHPTFAICTFVDLSNASLLTYIVKL